MAEEKKKSWWRWVWRIGWFLILIMVADGFVRGFYKPVPVVNNYYNTTTANTATFPEAKLAEKAAPAPIAEVAPKAETRRSEASYLGDRNVNTVRAEAPPQKAIMVFVERKAEVPAVVAQPTENVVAQPTEIQAMTHKRPTVTFRNTRNWSVSVYKVDPYGREISIGSIPTGGTFTRSCGHDGFHLIFKMGGFIIKNPPDAMGGCPKEGNVLYEI